MKKVLSFCFVLILLIGMLGMSVYADTGTDAAVISDLLNGTTSVFLLGVLGVLVFFVQLVVELTKSLPKIRAVPTQLWAIIVSLIISETALFVYVAWAGVSLLWYYPVFAIFTALVISYISTYGWDSLYKLWLRYSKPKL